MHFVRFMHLLDIALGQPSVDRPTKTNRHNFFFFFGVFANDRIRLIFALQENVQPYLAPGDLLLSFLFFTARMRIFFLLIVEFNEFKGKLQVHIF